MKKYVTLAAVKEFLNGRKSEYSFSIKSQVYTEDYTLESARSIQISLCFFLIPFNGIECRDFLS